MLNLLKNIFSRQEGGSLLLVALSLGAILIMTGLVIDGGHLIQKKLHLQKTANAAALSGAQELPNSKEDVNEVVGTILSSHSEATSLDRVEMLEKELRVFLKKEVPLFFAPLLGVESVTVSAEAAAGLFPVGSAKNAVPLGIDESVNLVYGQTYQLKVDAGDSVSGNFGVLALEGPGAKLYGESLKYGFGEQLQVGDIVNTQTGNIAGATRDGVNYRIANCPYPAGEYEHRDCSRIMLVIVYKPVSVTNGKLNSVEVTGFAYFYITNQMSSTDDSIKGIFIKRAGTGFAEINRPIDRGAYAIRLVK
jgi:hypothetical protein